jgi:hypothetical protein
MKNKNQNRNQPRGKPIETGRQGDGIGKTGTGGPHQKVSDRQTGGSSGTRTGKTSRTVKGVKVHQKQRQGQGREDHL